MGLEDHLGIGGTDDFDLVFEEPETADPDPSIPSDDDEGDSDNGGGKRPNGFWQSRIQAALLSLGGYGVTVGELVSWIDANRDYEIADDLLDAISRAVRGRLGNSSRVPHVVPVGTAEGGKLAYGFDLMVPTMVATRGNTRKQGIGWPLYGLVVLWLSCLLEPDTYFTVDELDGRAAAWDALLPHMRRGLGTDQFRELDGHLGEGVVRQRKRGSKYEYMLDAAGLDLAVARLSEAFPGTWSGKGGVATPKDPKAPKVPKTKKEGNGHHLLEHELHPLMVWFAANRSPFTRHPFFIKTIDEGRSSSGTKGEKEWLHPDMVAVEFIGGHENRTLERVREAMAGNSTQVRFYAFELKRDVTLGNLNEKFFQALSGTSWANEGYLVASSVATNCMPKLHRLCNRFGIGLILLDIECYENSTILISAQPQSQLDWDTMAELMKNGDFKEFVDTVEKVMKLHNDPVSAGALMRQVCDEAPDEGGLDAVFRSKG